MVHSHLREEGRAEFNKPIMGMNVFMVWTCVLGGCSQGRAIVDDSPVSKNNGSGDQRFEFSEFVKDNDDCSSLLDKVSQGRSESLLRRLVDTRNWFIKDEQVWVADQGARDEDPLLLSTGHRVQWLVNSIFKVNQS